MRMICVVFFVAFIFALAGPMKAFGEDSDKEKVVSGKVSVASKYDSNVDLLDSVFPENSEETEIQDAFISEVSLQLVFQSLQDSPWFAQWELFGLTDLFVESIHDSWLLGRSNIYIGYDFDQNTISFSNDSSYFSEPDDIEIDNFRNTATLVYTRVIDDLWQVRLGVENILQVYPTSNFFDYYANGGFFEFRNIWIPAFSTYYGYHFHYYRGGYNASPDDQLGSPNASFRHTAEIGFESVFVVKNSMMGAYTFQADNTTDSGANQIGEIRGEDENLETDAEFDFYKHKGMVLYSHRFNDRFTLSLYGELLHKEFPSYRSDPDEDTEERRDLLWLVSTWFTARLYDQLYARIRYIYRMNQSNIPYEDFQDHIGTVGLEYRF